jgi:hypothetical protein
LMLFYICVLSLSQREPFLRPTSLGQGVILNHQVFLLPQISFIYLSSAQTL